MDLFKVGKTTLSDQQFAESLQPFELKGKPVLVYSRLLSIGLIMGVPAVERLIEVLQEAVGQEGSLIFPSYTFSAYNKEPYDRQNSKCLVGVLGEVSRTMPGWQRTLHPVYANTLWGKHTGFLQEQSPHTCFGEGCFFEKFSTLNNAYVLMLGTNFNAATQYHYYDQRYGTPGRFVKEFDATLVDQGEEQTIRFDSFVKDYDFYAQRTNCLGRFDALATAMSKVERTPLGNDWVHGISEASFHQLYRACVKTDPLYFLFASKEEWESYYQKNQFRMFHGQLDPDQVEAVKQQL